MPVQDPVGGAVGFEVFKNVEQNLRNSQWCEYVSNSDILDILSRHRENLSEYLEIPEVLDAISSRTGVGSMIKIDIVRDTQGNKLKLSIFSSNGRDIVFASEMPTQSLEVDVLTRIINNWLNEYAKKIPYDGRVQGVLGDQFTFDVGLNRNVYQGQRLRVSKLRDYKKHPLLHEIVEWDFIEIAEAEVIQVAEKQSQARVLKYRGDDKVHPRNWIHLQRPSEERISEQRFEDQRSAQLGTLGEFTANLAAGRGEKSLVDDANSLKIRGPRFGGVFTGELWIMRNFWLGADLGLSFGSYAPKEGEAEFKTNSIGGTFYKIKAGYRYLPLGFFFGPQVDAFIGLARYDHGISNKPEEFITSYAYSGFLAGIRGNMPIYEGLRLGLEVDMLISPSVAIDTNHFGNGKSSSTYNLKIFSSYHYSLNRFLQVHVNHVSSKTSFIGPERVAIKHTEIWLGMGFQF